MKRATAILLTLLLQGYSYAQQIESPPVFVPSTDLEREASERPENVDCGRALRCLQIQGQALDKTLFPGEVECKEDIDCLQEQVKRIKQRLQKSYKRLCAFEPSTAIYRWAEDDENAIRVRYSFRYSLRSRKYLTGDCETGVNNVYFSYTGEFDFYVNGARSSSPVINRISSPALHFRKSLEFSRSNRGDGWRQSYWDIGIIEHQSTGQVTEVTSTEDQARAERAYLDSNRQYFDGISRGSNFASVELKFKNDNDAIWIKGKAYFSKDSSITWGPLKNSGLSISDYDRVRLIYKKAGGASISGNKDSETVLSWTIGDNGLPTSSFDIDYLFSRSWAIPLYVKYHYGPLYALADYTRKENYIGIGVKLVP